jgi:hypothetical protein
MKGKHVEENKSIDSCQPENAFSKNRRVKAIHQLNQTLNIDGCIRLEN